MTCDEFIRRLSAADMPAVDLRAHAEGCAACAPLWRADRELRRGGGAPAKAAGELPPALRALLAIEPGPARAAPAGLRALLPLAATAACLVLTLAVSPRTDLLQAVRPSFLLGLALLSGALVAMLRLHVSRGAFGLGSAPLARLAAVAACLLGFQLWGYFYARAFAGLLLESHQPSRDCLLLGCAVALFVGGVSFALGRRTVIVAPRLAGAVAGSAAGLAAVLVLHVHCAAVDAVHLRIVHALPLVMAIMTGVLAGRRCLRA